MRGVGAEEEIREQEDCERGFFSCLVNVCVGVVVFDKERVVLDFFVVGMSSWWWGCFMQREREVW